MAIVMTTPGAWGSGFWGSSPWGSSGGGAIELLSVLAVRENVVRVEFTVPIYFTGVFDPADGAHTNKWTVTMVEGTAGLDGEAVRPVMVSEVVLSSVLDVGYENYGRYVDVVLDRPMTPHPALYTVRMVDVFAADLETYIPEEEIQIPAVYKLIEPPQIESAPATRDIANAQTLSAAQSSLPDPTVQELGTIAVDDSGDYAFDEGLVNLKKRIYRRLVTRRGAFAHLPDYGVGIPDQGKKLALSGVLANLAAEAQTQIALEPEVAKVVVRPFIDPLNPGLVRFRVLVKTKVGQAHRFDTPFAIT